MAKRKTCWAKNAPQLLCFLGTVAYSLVFLAYHSELLSDPKGPKTGDSDSLPQTSQLNLGEVESKDLDTAGEGDAEAHAPTNSLDTCLQDNDTRHASRRSQSRKGLCEHRRGGHAASHKRGNV